MLNRIIDILLSVMFLCVIITLIMNINSDMKMGSINNSIEMIEKDHLELWQSIDSLSEGVTTMYMLNMKGEI